MNMILFIKAATAAPGQHDLFAGPVHVEGYVRAGKMVAGYDASRPKRPVNENPLPAAFKQHADHPHMDRKIGELAAENNGVVGHMIHEGNRADIRYKGGKMGVYVKADGKTHRISDLGEPGGHTTLRSMSHAIAGGLGPKVRYEPVGEAPAATETPAPKVTPAPEPKVEAEPGHNPEHLARAKAILAEQAASTGNPKAAAAVRRKIHDLARKVPQSDAKTAMVLDVASTRLNMGRLPWKAEAPATPKAESEPSPAPAKAPEKPVIFRNAPSQESAVKKRVVDLSAPEPEIKHFYVSALNGPRQHLVAGPYGSHQEALDRVEDVRKFADAHQPMSHFFKWGTAGTSQPNKTPLGENWKPRAEPEPAPKVTPAPEPPVEAETQAIRTQAMAVAPKSVTQKVGKKASSKAQEPMALPPEHERLLEPVKIQSKTAKAYGVDAPDGAGPYARAWIPKSHASVHKGHIIGLPGWLADKHKIKSEGTEARLKERNALRAQEKRQYLFVPFEKKDKAKAAGAKWDSDLKKWYVVGEPNDSIFEFLPFDEQRKRKPHSPASVSGAAPTVRAGVRKVTMPTTGYINEDDPSIWGSHLLGWEGRRWADFHANYDRSARSDDRSDMMEKALDFGDVLEPGWDDPTNYEKSRILFLKAHVDGYVKKTGFFVNGYENNRIHRAAERIADVLRGMGHNVRRVDHSVNRDGLSSSYIEADGFPSRFRVSDHAANPKFRVAEHNVPDDADEAYFREYLKQVDQNKRDYEAKKQAEHDALKAKEKPFRDRFIAAKEHERQAIILEAYPKFRHDKAEQRRVRERWFKDAK